MLVIVIGSNLRVVDCIKYSGIIAYMNETYSNTLNEGKSILKDLWQNSPIMKEKNINNQNLIKLFSIGLNPDINNFLEETMLTNKENELIKIKITDVDKWKKDEILTDDKPI